MRIILPQFYSLPPVPDYFLPPVNSDITILCFIARMVIYSATKDELVAAFLNAK